MFFTVSTVLITGTVYCKHHANQWPHQHVFYCRHCADLWPLVCCPDSEKVSLGGLLSLWSKQKTAASAGAKKEATVEEKGMYLDDLATLEDPEIAKLYLGSPR